ncbi:MAG: hypothetical protein ABIT08_12110 [Bacteroidia bacterium]
MKQTKRIYTVIAFMLGLLNQIIAQTDSSANRSIDNSNQYQNSNSITRDSNMVHQNQDAGTMQNQHGNSGNMQNEENGMRSTTNDNNSVNMNSRNMKDSTGSLNSHHAYMQDTMHAVKQVPPVKTVTPVKATQSVKSISPAKSTDNKNNVKKTKNKTMYLVPDSTKRKDTLK